MKGQRKFKIRFYNGEEREKKHVKNKGKENLTHRIGKHFLLLFYFLYYMCSLHQEHRVNFSFRFFYDLFKIHKVRFTLFSILNLLNNLYKKYKSFVFPAPNERARGNLASLKKSSLGLTVFYAKILERFNHAIGKK